MSTVLTWQPFSRPVARPAAPRAALGWMPHAEVSRDEEATVLRLEVPGVHPSDIEVSVVDDVLTIRGQRRTKTLSSGFERRFTLPADADIDGIAAHHDLGVLELRIPHLAPTRRVVPVAIGRPDEAPALEAEDLDATAAANSSN